MKTRPSDKENVKTDVPQLQGRRFKSPYLWTERVKTLAGGLTRTRQEFKDECNINTIVRRHNETGQLPELIKQNPQFGDFASMPDYMTSMNVVAHAHEQFDALPAHTRKRFNNNPAEFLEFAQDPENLPEMVKMGLAKKRENTTNQNDKKRENDAAPQQPNEAKKDLSAPKDKS